MRLIFFYFHFNPEKTVFIGRFYPNLINDDLVTRLIPIFVNFTAFSFVVDFRYFRDFFFSDDFFIQFFLSEPREQKTKTVHITERVQE